MSLLKNPTKELRNNILLILIIFLVSIGNSWIYHIFETSFFLGGILIIETTLLYLSFLLGKNKSIKILIFTILTMLCIYFLLNNYDKRLFAISKDEFLNMKHRRDYIFSELGGKYYNTAGKFYFNEYNLISNKIQGNLFSPLDWNLYFSTPDLRGEGKYNLLWGPIFIIGLVSLIVSNRKTIALYFFIALIVTTFINLNNKLGPLLLFPFINLCIGLGIINIVKRIKNIHL